MRIMPCIIPIPPSSLAGLILKPIPTWKRFGRKRNWAVKAETAWFNDAKLLIKEIGSLDRSEENHYILLSIQYFNQDWFSQQ